MDGIISDDGNNLDAFLIDNGIFFFDPTVFF